MEIGKDKIDDAILALLHLTLDRAFPGNTRTNDLQCRLSRVCSSTACSRIRR